MYRIKRIIRDIYYEIVYFFQRLFRGYSDPEVFNFDSYVIEYMLPRLRAFVKMKKMGHPTGLTEKKWQNILEKMLWSLENYDDLIVLKEYSEKEWLKIEKEIEEKYKDNEANKRFYLMWNKYKIDKEKTDKNYKRFQEGWDLFHKYFFNLWD